MSGKQRRPHRHVPWVTGVVQVVIGALVVWKFDGWWTYVVGGILLWLGILAIRTGLVASDQELAELTNEGDVSEETKKKFFDPLG